MSSFAIDLGEKSSYSSIAPRGGNAQIIENLAVSNQRSAFSQNMEDRLRPSADLGLGLGLGLGGPWVAQAWPKGHPSVAQGPSLGEIE